MQNRELRLENLNKSLGINKVSVPEQVVSPCFDFLPYFK